MKIRKINFLTIIFLLFLLFPIYSQESQNPRTIDSKDVHHNPWDLIIYRPENSSQINDVRCWLKLEDENGNDVTYSAIRKATYEWISIPDIPNNYKRTYYLSGGMAMHLNIKPGKYKISFYTPEKDHEFVEYDFENKGDWTSNIFEYNTDNPAKVIFLYPTANDNGFYNGGWIIDYKAPKYFKFTIPKMEN